MSNKTARKAHENGAHETGHAAEQAALNPAVEFSYKARANRRLSLAAIMNTMRILKRVNPGDAYYENYLGMIKKYKEDFFDTYQVLLAIGVYRAPKRILEIGTRTGISLCQLLSSYIDLSVIETVVCVDPFDQWTSANLVRANLKYLNLPAGDLVKILAMRSEDFLPKCEETFDYVLVDGDHDRTVCRNDLEGAHRVVELDGVIICDDLSPSDGECNLIGVWEDFKKSHLEEYHYAEILSGKGCGIAIRRGL